MKDQFKDISVLKTNLQFECNYINKTHFSWPKLKKIKSSSDDFIIKYKFSCLVEEPWDCINFSLLPITDIHFKPLYQSGIKLTKEKYKDIMSLLNFIPSVHHEFFSRLEYEDNFEEGVEEFPE